MPINIRDDIQTGVIINSTSYKTTLQVDRNSSLNPEKPSINLNKNTTNNKIILKPFVYVKDGLNIPKSKLVK